ncbi:hypothetical protein PspLS_05707 [Pyricularia sp. CBS 133598]|nr:hypothetical protein PspLS_05707 [Pyricularia sp. CBS 133598]
MREAQLRLDSIELALRKLPGKLRLESIITLGLPEEWPTDVTPAMISSKVAAGELWVERASPCRLHLDPVVRSGLDMIADDSLHERRLANVIRTCSAWELLGLQLSRCPRPVDENGQHVPGSAFYITHITSNSNHLACQYTARAEIRRLTCRLWFDFTAKPANKPATRQRQQGQTAISADSGRVTRSETKRSLQQSSEDVPSQSEHLLPAEVDRSVRILVRGSLYTLLGIRKPTPRIRRLCIFESPSLLEIAPAAFNMRYLQEVIQRAPFLHSISSVLARLVDNAQSLSLRQKVTSLAMGPAEASEMRTRPVNSTQDRVIIDKHASAEGIGKMIWPVLQTRPSNTKLYLEKLPEDRFFGANVDLEPDGDCDPVHPPSQQSEIEGLPSREQVNYRMDADDTGLDLHPALHDMKDLSNDLRHYLEEPEGVPSLDGEDQRLDNSSQEHMQKFYSRVSQYGLTWQNFQQDNFDGDDDENHQDFDEEGDTAGYYKTGHYSWVPDNDNEMNNPYLGFGNDYELESEGCPYFSASFAPRTVLDHEAGIHECYSENEQERMDITASQNSESQNLDHISRIGQVFVDEFGDEYVYEESRMVGYDERYTMEDGALSGHLAPWEWDVSTRVVPWKLHAPMNHADKIHMTGETKR